MDEKTNVQDEVVDMNESDVDMADFDAADEEFDMDMANSEIAKDDFEKQQYEELSQMNEQTEKMAAKFPDNFVLTPPSKEVADKYISKTLAKKARKRA